MGTIRGSCQPNRWCPEPVALVLCHLARSCGAALNQVLWRCFKTAPLHSIASRSIYRTWVQKNRLYRLGNSLGADAAAPLLGVSSELLDRWASGQAARIPTAGFSSRTLMPSPSLGFHAFPGDPLDLQSQPAAGSQTSRCLPETKGVSWLAIRTPSARRSARRCSSAVIDRMQRR
jgi:hypothetical protein